MTAPVFTRTQLTKMINLHTKYAIQVAKAGDCYLGSRYGMCWSAGLSVRSPARPYSQLEHLFSFLRANKLIKRGDVDWFVKPTSNAPYNHAWEKFFSKGSQFIDQRIDFHIFRVYCLELYRAHLYS